MARQDWVRTTRKHPCPICSTESKPRFGWCLLSRDGASVICGRTPSGKRIGNKGAGWLHVVGEAKPYTPPRQETKIVKPVQRDWAEVAMECEAALPEQDPLADQLGVSDESLGRLMLGWSDKWGCYTFPMRAGDGSIIGIRTRYRNGEKRAMTGSAAGIFIPLNIRNGDIWVCEGPTDCAALLTIGLEAIGRPSNTGGCHYIVEFMRPRKGASAFILADRDKPGSQAEQSTMAGANDLAAELRRVRRAVKIMRPPGGKDVREMVRDGATADMFRAIEKNTAWIV